MQAILNLTKELELTASGKAYVVEFENPRGGLPVRTWVALSQSKIESGKLFVAEWLLEPRRDGIGALLKAGYRCLMGDKIERSIGQTDTPRPALKSGVIAKGFFTVQGADEKHRTFRFKTNSKGQTLIGLMVGQNNITDYAWFGFVDGGIIRFWRTARYNMMATELPISHEAVTECFNAIIGNVEQAGKRFATYYKHCSRCGKILTTPESLERGLGAECAGLKYGKNPKKGSAKAFNDLYNSTGK